MPKQDRIQRDWRRGDPITATFLQEVTDAVFGRMSFGAGTRTRWDGGNLAVSSDSPRRGAQASVPFQVTKATPPEGHTGETGWIMVQPTGTVIYDIDPTHNIVITGLNNPFRLDIATNVKQFVYLTLDVTSVYNSLVAGPITGEIEHGTNWNSGGDFFPLPYEFDTDDGTVGGSGDDAANPKQIAFYIPLARTYTIGANPLDPITLKGFNLTSTVALCQLANTNFRLWQECADGKTITTAIPWTGAIQPPS
jgi:hypothetical protein